MILPIEIEQNIIDYDVNIVKGQDECYNETCTDEVYIYWNKKNIFGRVKRTTTVYKFLRDAAWQGGSKVWNRSYMCKAFLDRIKGIYTKEDIIAKLKEEFKGNDDFSLGVQHAIMVLEKKKEEA